MTSRWWYPLSVPTIGAEETEAVVEVLESGNTTMGERVEEFEARFAEYVGARHAVMVNSGSSADLLMARALNLRGEILVPAVTWPTHVWAWAMAGNDVKLIDVDGLNTTADIIQAHLTDRTVGVSLVHLMGVPVDLGGLADVGVVFTEDCCEALGAEWDGNHVGRFGTAAAWSFFFSHHMTTMEGGMVTTGSGDLARKMRSMRSHGWARGMFDDDPDSRYTFILEGYNLRPTEVAAAIGLVQLGRLDGFNKIRAENRALFADTLAGCPHVTLPAVPAGGAASWFGLPLLVEPSAAPLRAYLEDHGVETRPILGGNLARQPALARFSPGPLPGADRVHTQGLYIGLHPLLDSGVEQVAQLIGEFLG